MIARNTTPRRHRLTILATVFAAHILLIIILLQQRYSAPPSVTPTVIGLITIAAPPVPPASRPPPLSVPTKIIVASAPVPISIAPDSTADSAPGPAGACSTLGILSAALLADPEVLDAIRRAPPQMRSIADAVVIWSAGWAASTVDRSAPLAPVRALVEKSLVSSEDRCLDEPLAGPRLLAIPNGDRTMFLVFGSGNWTWRQLLTPAPPASSDPAPGATFPLGL